MDTFYAVQESDKIKRDFIKKEILVSFKTFKFIIFISNFTGSTIKNLEAAIEKFVK